MATQPKPSATRNLGRISEIAQVAVKHGFGYFFARHRLTDLLPWGSKVVPVESDRSHRGEHLREMFDELGPTFVKFGQLLSTRPDVVPPDIIVELRKLQDDVTPFPYEQVEQVVQAELGLPIEKLFVEFSERPIAAASIGQVHDATLPTGRRVAVKVQRPNAPRQVDADIQLLYQAAKITKERVRALDFVDARGLVDEFGRSIRQELDYRHEARNAQAFHRNFAGDPHVHIPKVIWSYTRARVLTLEYLEGVQVQDLDLDEYTLEQRRRLAYLVTEAWMTMIFRHGVFHGDPHPANILVLGDPEQIGLVDFGLAGKLSDDDMTKLTRLFLDAANENVEMLPRRLADLGVRYDRSREDEFVVYIRELYDKYYGSRLSEIDPLALIREAFAAVYAMNLRLPTRFVMLDKAIATLGSVGIELYPDFNVFEVAQPYARDLMISRYTPRRVLADAQKEAFGLARVLREAPYQWHDFLEQVRDGQIEVGFVHKGLDEFFPRIEQGFNRLVIALVAAGGLIGSSLIGVFATGGPHVFGLHVIALVGFILSGILGAWLLWGVVRSGRL
jgi:ubiquinone biosynthesis protein